MFYDRSTFMSGMHWFWWIFWVVLIGVVVLCGWGRPSERRRQPGETMHEVLQRRLASGEITPEEYEKRNALLDRHAGART